MKLSIALSTYINTKNKNNKKLNDCCEIPVFILFITQISIGSCISSGDANDADKQSDAEASYSIRKSTAPTASYSHNVIIEDISIEEFHKAAEHSTASREGSDAKSGQIPFNDEASNLAAVQETFCVEIDRLSLANRKLSDQLQSVRHQLNDNLNRVRDFEERVKVIPKLQLELSVEKAENRDMHIKVKALENVLKTKERNDNKLANDISNDFEPVRSPTIREFSKAKQFNTQRVCATSLESLNVRFSNASPVDLQKVQEAAPIQLANQPVTHNVGCMTTKSVLRDVGIVTVPIVADTKAVAVNTNISGPDSFEDVLKKPKMQSVSVHSQCEPKIATKNAATITDAEPIHRTETKSIGVMCSPNVTTSSCMARPESRSIGVENIYQKTRTRTIGVDPIKPIDEHPSTNQNSSRISLKLLDNIQGSATTLLNAEKLAEVKTKPKEYRTMGIQHSPNQSDKYSQCKEFIAEPLPKVPSRTESTDTCDLVLLIHRGVNTEMVKPKTSQFTNTDRIFTDEKSTNTLNSSKNLKTSQTNTDPSDMLAEKMADEKPNEPAPLNEHKCHNCLAKIEIRQRTIIKNPNKSHNITSIASASASSSVDQTSCEELTLQQTDSQTRIPRPTALISPRSEKKFTRQNTYTVHSSPTTPVESTAACPAEIYL